MAEEDTEAQVEALMAAIAKAGADECVSMLATLLCAKDTMPDENYRLMRRTIALALGMKVLKE